MKNKLGIYVLLSLAVHVSAAGIWSQQRSSAVGEQTTTVTVNLQPQGQAVHSAQAANAPASVKTKSHSNMQSEPVRQLPANTPAEPEAAHDTVAQNSSSRPLASIESVNQRKQQVAAVGSTTEVLAEPKPIEPTPLPQGQSLVASPARSHGPENTHEEILGDILRGAQQVEATASESPASSAEKDELIRLLHAAINRNKHYPRAARSQRREGAVTVRFAMDTQGELSALAVAQSSRFGALDRAALKAVASVSPFEPAARYLQRESTFSVSIVFKLP